MLAHYRLQLGPFHFHANRLTPKDKEHLVAKGAVKDEKTRKDTFRYLVVMNRMHDFIVGRFGLYRHNTCRFTF